MKFDLYWTSKDEQTDVLVGEDFDTPSAAEEAIPSARLEMISQLGSGDSGDWIDDGKFYCQAK